MKWQEGNVFTVVCLSTGKGISGAMSFPGGQCLWYQVPYGDGYVQGVGYSPLPSQIHGTYGRQVSGTHPIGMLSCLRIELIVYEGIIMNINLLDLARFYRWKKRTLRRQL